MINGNTIAHSDAQGHHAPIIIRPDSTPSFLSDRGVSAKRRLLRNKGFPTDFSGWHSLTLTIAPVNYLNPAAAYEAAKNRLPKFFSSLSKHGYKWKRYVWKMELHESNGYPHYHVLLDCRYFIPAELITKIWSLGRTEICRLNGGASAPFRYITKRVNLPAWAANLEKARFMQTSRGFYAPDAQTRTHPLINGFFPTSPDGCRRRSQKKRPIRNETIGERQRRRDRTVMFIRQMADGSLRRDRFELKTDWQETQAQVMRATATQANFLQPHAPVRIMKHEIQIPDLPTLGRIMPLIRRIHPAAQ